MEMFLIGAVVGAGLVLATIFLNFKVMTTESWEKHEQEMAALHSCFHVVVAANAKLRVSLAAGAMTEDAKKVATMTMAALDAVMAEELASRRSRADEETAGNSPMEFELEKAKGSPSELLADNLPPQEVLETEQERCVEK